jgi:hypothetical protein
MDDSVVAAAVIVVIVVVVVVVVMVVVMEDEDGSDGWTWSESEAGNISGQMISILLQSFAPTNDTGTSVNDKAPFGKSDLRKQDWDWPFQLNNLQRDSSWHSCWHFIAVVLLCLMIKLLPLGNPIPSRKQP